MSTHQHLLYHIVFSTKNRKPYLKKKHTRQAVFAYLAGTAKELGGFALIVDGFVDHVHLLVRVPAKISLAEFVGKLKSSSSKHLNQTSGTIFKFGWQNGYGAFTVSFSQKDSVYRYIENQWDHHSNQTFENEYLSLLKRHDVEYDAKFVLSEFVLTAVSKSNSLNGCVDPSGLLFGGTVPGGCCHRQGLCRPSGPEELSLARLELC